MTEPQTEPPLISRLPRLVEYILVAAFLAFAGNLIFGLGAPELDGFFNNGVYLALIVVPAILVLARALTVRKERAGWLCLGIGLATTAFAEIYWAVEFSNAATVPVPSIADAGWLLTYPIWCFGLALVIRSRVRRFRTVVWLDAAIVALAVGALSAAFIAPSIVEGAGTSFAAVATSVAYPIGDVLLVAFVAGMLILTGWRRDKSWALVSAALIVVAIGDTIYGYEAAAGTYVVGTWLDLAWPLSAMLLGFSAWRRPPKQRAQMPVAGLRAIFAPAASSLLALGILVFGYVGNENAAAVGLAAAALLAAAARMALAFHENQRLYAEVQTDPLTGLSNRGKLLLDLRDEIERAEVAGPRVLAMFDLDGFKLYNDTFGHGAGDTMLKRLGGRLSAAIGEAGKAYRIGGDEFCVLLTRDVGRSEVLIQRCLQALRMEGSGFSVGASHGSALVPGEADSPEQALQLVDARMYVGKRSSRVSARSQAQQVLMRVLRESEPGLGTHVDQVGELAVAVGRHFVEDPEELDLLRRAAELHDIGKMAVPDGILAKPDALDDEEWAFIRDHTLVGERILRSADALAPAAQLVRSSHERFDGGGYPDGLAGEEIPLGSRIIFVCDAFHAMTASRPYSPAIPSVAAVAELRACAGTQFDPRVVEIACREIGVRGQRSFVSSPSSIRESASTISARAPR
jgi:diguanylate cyclase (GGDEF)-like protein